jgi:hypothetical protein
MLVLVSLIVRAAAAEFALLLHRVFFDRVYFDRRESFRPTCNIRQTLLSGLISSQLVREMQTCSGGRNGAGGSAYRFDGVPIITEVAPLDRAMWGRALAKEFNAAARFVVPVKRSRQCPAKFFSPTVASTWVSLP